LGCGQNLTQRKKPSGEPLVELRGAQFAEFGGAFPLWQRRVGQLEQFVGDAQQLRDGIGVVRFCAQIDARIRQFSKAFPVRGHAVELRNERPENFEDRQKFPNKTAEPRIAVRVVPIPLTAGL
jgi:hypothetical protein